MYAIHIKGTHSWYVCIYIYIYLYLVNHETFFEMTRFDICLSQISLYLHNLQKTTDHDLHHISVNYKFSQCKHVKNFSHT